MESCRLCGAEETHPFAHWKVNYLKCSRCQYVQQAVAELPEPVFEKERYAEHNNTFENQGYVQFLGRFVADFEKVVPHSNGKSLDYGCGPGPVLSRLVEELGYRVEYYDPFFFPNESLLKEEYELITCCETVEHFHYPEKEFAKLFSLLKPGGVLAVRTEPLPDKGFEDWYYHRDPTHVGFFNKDSFQYLSKVHNVRVEFLSSTATLFRKTESSC